MKVATIKDTIRCMFADQALHRAMLLTKGNDERRHEAYAAMIPLVIPHIRAGYALAGNHSAEVKIQYQGLRDVRAVVVFARSDHKLDGKWYTDYDFLIVVDPRIAAADALVVRSVCDGIEKFEKANPDRIPDDWLRSAFGGATNMTGDEMGHVLRDYLDRPEKAAQDFNAQNPKN